MTVLEALMPIIRVLANLFSKVLGAAIAGLKPIIEAWMGYLRGIIDFVTGVFTGDWGKAWEGVKNIFRNIVNGLVAIFKLPINLIIEGINFFLGGLNKLKIPDWVPGIGGKGINIPLIPKLAKGSDNTPDTFIAGEAGAELITNAKGRKVFTAAQTGEIFKNLAVSMRQPAAAPPSVSVTTGGRGGINIKIESNPVIQVDGGKPDDLEAKLKAAYEHLAGLIMERLRQERETAERVEYA
jgi:hypothetical protein